MASARPSVSFVVTVYNKARYLPGVIDAIAAQQGDFARQCVFVDDGSTDGSLAILRQRTAAWADTVIVAQANAGPSPASNAGLAWATGEYVKFVDGDDVLAPGATAHLLGLLQRHGADLALGAGDHYDPGQAAPAATAMDDPGALMPDALGALLTNPLCNLSQVLVRRAACVAVRGFDERIFVQDYPFLLRLSQHHRFASSRAAVCYFPRQQGGRLTDNHANMLFHANLTPWLFCLEHDLPLDRLQYASRRCIGRAWLYAKRHRGKGVASVEFRQFLADRLMPARDRRMALDRMRATFAAFGDEPMRRYATLIATMKDQSAAS